MYAPKYRCYRSTASFQLVERERSVSRSRTKLHRHGRSPKRSPSRSRRGRSLDHADVGGSTGSLPLALAQQRLRLSPFSARRRGHTPGGDEHGESPGVLRSAASSRHQRRKITRRSISAPATPMYDDDDLEPPRKLPLDGELNVTAHSPEPVSNFIRRSLQVQVFPVNRSRRLQVSSTKS